MKRVLIIFLLLTISTKSFSQLSFTDILIVHSLENSNLVERFLESKGFELYKKYKDENKWNVKSYVNGNSVLEFRHQIVPDEDGQLMDLYSATFVTSEDIYYTQLLNEVKASGWRSKEVGQRIDKEGFKTALYNAAKYEYNSKYWGVIIGHRKSDSGQLYRFQIL